MIALIVLGILLGALAVMFALQNITPITVAFLTWHITGSLATVLFVTLIVGFVISLLFSIPSVIRNYMVFRELNNRNKKLEADLLEVKRQLADAQNKLAAQTPPEIPPQPNV